MDLVVFFYAGVSRKAWYDKAKIIMNALVGMDEKVTSDEDEDENEAFKCISCDEF